jgi:ABC-type microcin C transport system duplicated ATPase subunit YejF
MILEVKKLSISFENKQIIEDISFSLDSGKINALIGESGSGKSTIALSILKILNKAKISGEIIFCGNDLLKFPDYELRKIRGKNIGMVFQNPSSSLNPLHKIGKQIAEAIEVHNPKISKEEIKLKIKELLKIVELENLNEERLEDYPHQFSGGQKQRIMIAIAIANNPKLLIVDEPTTALDSDSENEILKLFLKLKNTHNIAILFITHNLKIVKNIADRIIVLNDKKIIENGSVKEIFTNPQNDYTKKLLSLSFLKNFDRKNINPQKKILDIKNLSICHSSVGLLFKKSKKIIDDVSFFLNYGENIALIGNSGSGKSTIALALMNMIKYQGEIFYFEKKWQRDFCKKIQILFQDPFSILNPRMTVGEIVEEGLIIHKIENCKIERQKIIDSLLDQMKLDLSLKNYYPHQLSGGQKQRVAIARVLAVKPQILILDEPTSALDLITQNEILDLLLKIQKNNNVSYILISHDLEIVNSFCSRVLIIKNGKIHV